LQPADSEAQLSTDHSEIRKNSKKDSATGKNTSNAVFSTAIRLSSAESLVIRERQMRKQA
jgi:hypothetical protein